MIKQYRDEVTSYKNARLVKKESKWLTILQPASFSFVPKQHNGIEPENNPVRKLLQQHKL